MFVGASRMASGTPFYGRAVDTPGPCRSVRFSDPASGDHILRSDAPNLRSLLLVFGDGAGLDLRTAPDWLQRPTCQARPKGRDYPAT
jgi:hypothetical protein